LPWRGIAFGVITALGQAGGNLFARPAMAAGVEPFTAMAIRSGLAALIFVALSVTPVATKSRAPLRFDAVALALAAAFVGTGLGMSALMAALHTGDVGVVSTLSSMTPVLILPMVWIRNGVRPSAPAWAGALLAIAGTALISLR
jgi:drug/metabolite transporter (DMT)-like permease